MDYISTKEAAQRWGVSIRYVRHLLSENRIPGAKKYGVSWISRRQQKAKGSQKRTQSRI